RSKLGEDGNGADNNRRHGHLLSDLDIGRGHPAQKLLVGALILLIAALKPFWVKFTEGLADLLVRVIEYKLQQRLPGFGKDTGEIASKASDGEPAKATRATSADRRRKRKRHRSPRRKK